MASLFRPAVSGGRTSAPRVDSIQSGERPDGLDIEKTDDDGVLLSTALESRADIANLDALQAKRRKLVKDYAPLAAKFKGGQSAGSDSARKRHRAGVANLILREQFREKGEKDPSEAALERMANADPRHVEFCEGLEQEFADFLMLENDILEVTEQIRNREECLRAYRAELSLGSHGS